MLERHLNVAIDLEGEALRGQVLRHASACVELRSLLVIALASRSRLILDHLFDRLAP